VHDHVHGDAVGELPVEVFGWWGAALEAVTPSGALDHEEFEQRVVVAGVYRFEREVTDCER
jgi:hypothetical protein